MIYKAHALESHLSSYLDDLVKEKLEICFYKRLPSSLLASISKRNAFYSLILTCVFYEEEPTSYPFYKSEIDDPESLYQNGLYLYEKWKKIGLEKAVFNYCQLMNRFMSQIPFPEGEASDYFLSDFCNEAPKISSVIKGYKRAQDRDKKI